MAAGCVSDFLQTQSSQVHPCSEPWLRFVADRPPLWPPHIGPLLRQLVDFWVTSTFWL